MSDDDIHDDVDYLDDDDIYADGTGTSIGSEEEDDEDDDLYAVEEAKKEEREKNCTVMSADVIRQRQEEAISSVSSVLAVSRSQAIILLLHFKWVVSTVQEKWCIEQEEVRELVGLFEKPIVDIKKDMQKQNFTCGICFESYPHTEMHDARAGGCGHLFCEPCWRGYIDTSVNDGPKCLMLQCPDPSCNAAVGQDMVNAFICEESKQKYSDYLLRSSIEDSKNIKWCPAPYCGSAIKFEAGSESRDVTCECYYSFCWDCNTEAHTPVNCGTVEKWTLKNSDESENVRWMLVHSKPCPNCRRPIEKSVGCNHMRCSICQFAFCWLCLVSLKDHHSCNSYKQQKNQGADDNLMTEREMARRHLSKYTHFYERWEANHRSLNQAVESMKIVDTPARMDLLCFIMCLDKEKEEDMKLIKVIKDAWVQIIECRRVLKWSYAYGYYLPEHEYGKIDFFDDQQGQAELGLERLHGCAEGLQACQDAEHPLVNFKIFVKELEKQTTDTGHYFKELVSALKNDLSEVVNSQGAGNNIKRPPRAYETQTRMGSAPYDRRYTAAYDQRHTPYDYTPSDPNMSESDDEYY